MIPLQFLCRNDHIFSGTLSCPHNYIADSRLDNHPRTERAGPRPVNRIIGWVHARQIQIRSQGLLSGTVQQGILLCMDSAANIIPLSLMHISFHPRTGPNITAVVVAPRRAVIPRRHHHIIFHDNRSVLSLNAGAPVSENFRHIQISIRLGYPVFFLRFNHVYHRLFASHAGPLAPLCHLCFLLKIVPAVSLFYQSFSAAPALWG